MRATIDTPGSTLADVRAPAAGPIRAWPRRVGLALLLIIVLLGAFGWLGVHERTTTTSAATGYTMKISYPQVARAGLDVPFRILVHRDSGDLPAHLTIAVSSDYFRMFETQGFFPNADAMTNDGTFVYFTFDKPMGSTFELEYDAYIQPSAQIGKDATIRAIVGGQDVAQAHIHTWLAP